MRPLNGIAFIPTEPDAVRAMSRQVFYAVKESAELGRVTCQTIRRLLRAGELTEYHAGRNLRVHAAELHEFLEAGRVSIEPTVRRLEDVAQRLNADQRARLAVALGISASHTGAGVRR